MIHQTPYVCMAKEEALQTLLTALIQKYQPEKILCFGKIQSQNQYSGCFLEDRKHCYYHYFLLMVTYESTRIEHQVQDFVNAHFAKDKITILVHGNETVRQAILKGSRFFTTVYTSSDLLYAADGIFQALKADSALILPITKLEKARKHFSLRFPMARGFLSTAFDALDIGHYYNVAVFILHQAMEQALAALIQVYLAYRTDIHNLSRLLDLYNCFLAEPDSLFARTTKEDQRLLNLLNNSYSAARYKDAYAVNGKDANLIYEKVNAFLLEIERLCLEQIANYEKEATDGKYRIEKKDQEMEECHG